MGRMGKNYGIIEKLKKHWKFKYGIMTAEHLEFKVFGHQNL